MTTFRYYQQGYFIKYGSTVKSIYFKVCDIAKELEVGAEKIYDCPKCKLVWTQLEVIDNMGKNGFICKCGTELIYYPEKLSRFQKQTEFIWPLLSRIDIDILDDSLQQGGSEGGHTP